MTISRILLCSSCGSSMKSHKCFILTQYNVSECSWKNYLIYPAAAAAAKSLQSYPTLWPHRWQPTRFPHPWDSPGKNTGVGCHFLLQCMKVKSESEVTQSCPILATPWPTAYQAPPSMGFSRQEYWSGVPLPSLIWYTQEHRKDNRWLI